MLLVILPGQPFLGGFHVFSFCGLFKIATLCAAFLRSVSLSHLARLFCLGGFINVGFGQQNQASVLWLIS